MFDDSPCACMYIHLGLRNLGILQDNKANSPKRPSPTTQEYKEHSRGRQPWRFYMAMMVVMIAARTRTTVMMMPSVHSTSLSMYSPRRVLYPFSFFINKCIYVYLLIAPRLGLILCLLSVQSNLFAVALFISHFCLLFLS